VHGTTEQVWRIVGAPLAVAVTAALVLPPVVGPYWLQVFTAAVVYAVVALGLGILYGRVGLISMGQIAILAIGGWTALRLDQAFALPFPLLLLAVGLVTAVVGVLIGLPALRLSGLHLALVTLMLAAALAIVLTNAGFPNGGGGLLGHDPLKPGNVALPRPGWATTDGAYFRLTVLVCGLMFALALAHLHGRPGRAWAAIRQSEFAARAAGINVTLYKLVAFALACFMTGVAGGLLAASSGGLSVYQFAAQESISLLAVVLMAGMGSPWGAVLAGVLMKVMPAVFDGFGVSSNLLLVIFGLGLVQTLVTSPGGIVGQLGHDLGRLRRTLRARRAGAPAPGEPEPPDAVPAARPGTSPPVRSPDDGHPAAGAAPSFTSSRREGR
jgi:branched-chain amino acid transport system permease protein